MKLFLTGNKYFNIFIRKIAKKHGIKISNYSITYKNNKKSIKINSEKDVFELLNLRFISPKYRVFSSHHEFWHLSDY